MKRLTWVVVLVAGVAAVAAFASLRPSLAADDEAPNVRAQCEAIVSAWNKHDAKGIVVQFAEDADTFDHTGAHLQGRAAVEKMFADMHTGTGPMRESKVEVKNEPIRFLSDDIAITDADVVVTNSYGPDGKKGGPLLMRITNVWKKTDGKWLVVASRPCGKGPAPAH